MGSEQELFARAKGAIEGVVGFVPGAVEDGVLCVLDDNAGVLAYRVVGSAPDLNGRLAESFVAGLELSVDLAAARRIPAKPSEPSVREYLDLAKVFFAPNEWAAGVLPASDDATLVAVAGETGTVRVLACWHEDAATAVLVPATLHVPRAALVPYAPVPARRDRRERLVPDDTRVPHVEERPRPTPSRRGALVWGAVATTAAIVAALVFRPTAKAPQAPQIVDDRRAPALDSSPASLSISPKSLALPLQRTSKIVVASVLDSSGKTAAHLPIVWVSDNRRVVDVTSLGDSARVVPRGAGTAHVSARLATPPLSATTVVIVSAPPQQPIDPATKPAIDSARTSSAVDAPDVARVIDELYRQATDAEPRTPEQWISIATQASRAFERSVERRNRQRAAEAAVYAYTFAGGRPEACRLIAFLGELSNLVDLRSKNGCS